jgi:hypothetical protein
MVGREGLFWASCPPPLRGHHRFASMFKFAPGELVKPSIIGLKDSRLIYQVFINQSLTVFVFFQSASIRQ